MPGLPVSRTFLAALPPNQRGGWEMTALEHQLETTIEQAREAWPTVDHPAVPFVQFLAEKLSRLSTVASRSPLSALSSTDLYLTCACAAGNDRAICSFLAVFSPIIDASLRQLNVERATADDVKAELLAGLLVAEPDRPPRVRNFSGTGRLKAWLRTIAVRSGMRTLRGRPRRNQLDDHLLRSIPAPCGDPEIEHFRLVYAPQFQDAMFSEFAQLSARQRNLLRQFYVDGLSLDELAALYRVHRATSARWLATARQSLFERTRSHLSGRLKLTRSEVESVIRLAISHPCVGFRSWPD
jgi:RNA polymerase sigma-70 factor, ECF subfamily